MHCKDVYAISTVNVAVGAGTPMLARIAIVDWQGNVVLDTFVAPTMKVADFRSSTTGLDASHFRGAPPFNAVQQRVASLIKGKILVGHSLWQDLSVLGIPHACEETRDAALYLPFRNALRSPNQIIGLQTLSWQLMRRRCQEGYHEPLENARASLDLYRSYCVEWEAAVSSGTWPCALPPATFSRCYL